MALSKGKEEESISVFVGRAQRDIFCSDIFTHV